MTRVERAALRQTMRMAMKGEPQSKSTPRFALLAFAAFGVLALGVCLGLMKARSEGAPALRDSLDPASYDPNALVAKLATSHSPEEQAKLLEALTRGTSAPTPGGARGDVLRVGTEAWRTSEADPEAFVRKVQGDPLQAHRAFGVRSPTSGVPDPLASLAGGSRR